MTNAYDNYYKRPSRARRVQAPETSFREGMVYTKAPIEDGRVRALVNYDLIDDMTSLVPRPALKPSLIGAPVSQITAMNIGESVITAQCGRDAVEENDKRFRLVVCGALQTDPAQIPNTQLVAGEAMLCKMRNDAATLDYFADAGVTTKAMQTVKLTQAAGADPSVNHFVIPRGDSVHGVHITDKTLIARAVGTFAYGSSYYNFNAHGELIRTMYDTELNGGDYKVEYLEPRLVTPKEAVQWGYNMLLSNPYSFNDSLFASTIQLNGLLPYGPDGNINLTPMVNDNVTLRCFYSGTEGSIYKFVWEWKENTAANWQALETKELTLSDPLPELKVTTSFAVENVMVRIAAYKKEGETFAATTEKMLVVGFNFNKAGYGSSANIELKNYDLSKCSGMLYWKQRVWLYGVAQDPTILFASEINDASYFPYPQNIDIFDEPIVYAMPFMDNLLVFTRTQIIQITMDETNMTWSKKIIQGSLDFTDWDVHLIQIVKNMVFFKSGNYYYMVVPKTISLKNELAIAPVSKNIEYFLDDFSGNVKEVIEAVYGYTGTLDLVNYYNYLDYEDIKNVYTFKTVTGVYINFVLLYSTMYRTWRLYLYESQTCYYPFRADATKQCSLMTTTKLTIVQDAVTVKSFMLQFLDRTNGEVADSYIPGGLDLTFAEGTSTNISAQAIAAFESAHVFKNWQMLDTGYRDHSFDINKRYRELQFKFNNLSKKTLNFNTEFWIDGDLRITPFRYKVNHITDPEAPDYSLLYIDREMVTNLDVPGDTVLADTQEDINSWQLDVSRFPELMLWKARMRVSGKGFAPRFRLVSRNEERYEFIGYTWVFRMMNSR